MLALAAVPPTVAAQSSAPRFGLGFNLLPSTIDGLGVGFTGRISAPVNADLSLGADLGFSGFVLEGRRNATYVFQPQLSAIVTLPERGARLPYILVGLGAYVPIGDDEGDSRTGGPTLHGGVGWVHGLRETSVYYEIDPALIIAEERVHLAIPLRIGVIF